MINRYTDEWLKDFFFLLRDELSDNQMVHSGSVKLNPLGRQKVSDIHDAWCSSLTEQLLHSYLLLYLPQYNYPH